MSSGNQSNPKRRRVPWWWALSVLAVAAAAVLIHWLAKPLPAPRVTVEFIGFHETNGYWSAVMSITNHGPSKIRFDKQADRRGHGWRVEYNMPSGPGGAWGLRFPNPMDSLPGGSNRLIYVPMGGPATNWQVIVPYYYHTRHHAQIDLREWLIGSGRTGKVADALYSASSHLVSRLPDPPKVYRSYTTPWLTNRLPDRSSAE